MRDECPNDHTTGDGGLEGFLELQAVEPEDHDVDGLLRGFDRAQQWCEAVFRLDDEFHRRRYLGFFLSSQSTEACPSGSSLRMASVTRSVFISSGTCTS